MAGLAGHSSVTSDTSQKVFMVRMFGQFKVLKKTFVLCTRGDKKLIVVNVDNSFMHWQISFQTKWVTFWIRTLQFFYCVKNPRKTVRVDDQLMTF